MSFTSRHPATDRVPAQRRFVGFRLRSVSWIVLAGWLFTLLVCAVSDLAHRQGQSHHPESATHSYADSHSEQDGSARHAGVCCTELESLSPPSQATDIPLPAYRFVYILLPYIIVLQAVLFAGARIQVAATGPPGRPKHTLIANSLWPNAPPR